MDVVLCSERLDAAGPGHGLGRSIARGLARPTWTTLTPQPDDLCGLQRHGHLAALTLIAY